MSGAATSSWEEQETWGKAVGPSSFSACRASQEQLFGHCVTPDAGLDKPSLVQSSTAQFLWLQSILSMLIAYQEENTKQQNMYNPTEYQSLH